MIRVVERQDHYEVPFEGMTVSQCRVDHAFELLLREEDRSDATASIRIESRFRVGSPDQEWVVVPDRDPTTLGPALALFQRRIASISAFKSGRLDAHFVDGWRLTVESHPDYEAWQLRGDWSPGRDLGIMIVCMPGGKLAIWNPEH